VWEEAECRWKAEFNREKKVHEHIQLTDWEKCSKLEYIFYLYVANSQTMYNIKLVKEVSFSMDTCQKDTEINNQQKMLYLGRDFRKVLTFLQAGSS
jgi:hypothetical protein